MTNLFRTAATALALFAGLGLATQVSAREHQPKIEKIEKVEKAQKVEKVDKPEKPEKHSNR